MDFYQATVGLCLRDIFTAYRNSKQIFLCNQIYNLINIRTGGEIWEKGDAVQDVLKDFLFTHYPNMFKRRDGCTIDAWLSEEICNQLYTESIDSIDTPFVDEVRAFRLSVIDMMEKNPAPLDYVMEFTVPVVYR